MPCILDFRTVVEISFSVSWLCLDCENPASDKCFSFLYDMVILFTVALRENFTYFFGARLINFIVFHHINGNTSSYNGQY